MAGEASAPLVRDFLGICGHTIQFKPTLYAPVCRLVRDYHPVEWDLANRTGERPKWPFAKNQVDWKGVYSSWAEGGFRTDVCLMFETIPPEGWQNREADFAAYAAAFAAYFGPEGTVPLVESVEIGNEPGRYTDEQYAALLAAALPALRRSAPKLKLATCNLTTGKSHDYAKSVDTLAGHTGNLDVLTIHTYAEAEPWPTWRRSYPEDPSIPYLADVRNLARWRDRQAPGKAIWITEFGYDSTTQEPDPKTEFARWKGVSDQQQAQYLVRSVLLFLSLPVERAYIFFFNDQDEAKLHSSSGITRKFQPKPSYYALVHLQATLGDYRLAGVIAQRASDVHALEFVHQQDLQKRVVVAWSPTGSSRAAQTTIKLPEKTRIIRAERMPLENGAAVELPIPSASALPIDESPLYLHLEPAE